MPRTTRLAAMIGAIAVITTSTIGSVGASASPTRPKIAVTTFELQDFTPTPRTPEELARTSALKGQLETALIAADGALELVPLDEATHARANQGASYLYEHDDEAARLGHALGADVIAVGRLQKPSFLFMYLMVHLVNVDSGERIAEYAIEVKGQQKVGTQRGVERLAQRIATKLQTRGE